MSHQVTLGGERLGAGKRNKISLREYERSTHDLSYVWRSTMASGTVVPCLVEVALPGDTFDIHINMDVLTHPTIGPLFGSYKTEVHLFQAPVRLYNGKLHMNLLGVGMDMSKVGLPQIELKATQIDRSKNIDNQQINPSCILSYLGMRGLGWIGSITPPALEITRRFNAIAWLGYWDIYKNYIANKQEEIGAVIHRSTNPNVVDLNSAALGDALPDINITVEGSAPWTFQNSTLTEISRLVITANNMDSSTLAQNIGLRVKILPDGSDGIVYPASVIFRDWQYIVETETLIGTNPHPSWVGKNLAWADAYYDNEVAEESTDTEPKIVTFPLTDIDEMRKRLLSWHDDTDFIINNTEELTPYKYLLEQTGTNPDIKYSKQYNQEGLGLKTYQSDLFNNWIQTEWIDGEDGISAVTAVDTSGGSFTIDELNLSKKIYDMLNRIAISGGSYDDWLDAVYTHDRTRSAENPIYLGGLMQNLVFQEVVSNAASENQPLGTLAGRGTMGNKRKGGTVVVKVDEPSFLIGIVSITPNLDYSQGNKWDTNLKTMNDFHKPALDEIGFQDLSTDQMAWWDTQCSAADQTIMKSAGKQPAWINYMTNVNQVRGNFADQSQQMFMVLNRRYGVQYGTSNVSTIRDLTTYIDPTKFNHIFADTRRDAQNFWTQIGFNIEARRKMSAKVIPNL